MKYPATIIQSEYTDFAIWFRPAAKGWEVIIATQIAEKHKHVGATSTQVVKTVSRKREVAKAITEAIQCVMDSINKTMVELSDEEDWEVSIGQGFIEDDEMAH